MFIGRQRTFIEFQINLLYTLFLTSRLNIFSLRLSFEWSQSTKFNYALIKEISHVIFFTTQPLHRTKLMEGERKRKRRREDLRRSKQVSASNCLEKNHLSTFFNIDEE